MLEFTYPYGSHKGQPIEYRSYWRNGSVGESYGLNATQDEEWVQTEAFGEDLIFSNATDVSKYLPLLDSDEFEVRIGNGSKDFTDVYKRDGSYATTRLWAGDEFWWQACSRMVLELEVLESKKMLQENKGKNMEVMVKHYGISLPDAQNFNSTVWSYIFVTVNSEGGDAISSFSEHCEEWFGELAMAAEYVGEAALNASWTQVLLYGDPVLNSTNATMTMPPPLDRATAGGIKAIQADENSNFTLWIIPTDPQTPDADNKPKDEGGSRDSP